MVFWFWFFLLASFVPFAFVHFCLFFPLSGTSVGAEIKQKQKVQNIKTNGNKYCVKYSFLYIYIYLYKFILFSSVFGALALECFFPFSDCCFQTGKQKINNKSFVLKNIFFWKIAETKYKKNNWQNLCF